MSTSSRRGIITGGTWCLDRNKMVEFWPAEDGLAEVLDEVARGGGAGCNMAIDVKRLDPTIPVETIALVGDDGEGRLLIEQADSYGIDRTQMHVAPGVATQSTDAYASQRSGRRTHIYRAGAAVLLTPDHFDLSQTRARLFHSGLPGVHKGMDRPWHDDPNGWVTVFKKARAAGLATNLELASVARERIAELARPCLPHLDLLVVNDVEIGAIAGETTETAGDTDVEACLQAARHVLESGAMQLVVVHFPKGAIAVGRDGAVQRRPSVRVPPAEVAAANGAGDAFASGIVYGWHEGWALGESLSLAHAAAAASLRHISTSDAVETWQGCLALAERWGWREAM